MRTSIWLGWDPREAAAYAVARASARNFMRGDIPIRGVVLERLRGLGLYRRKSEIRDGYDGHRVLWDTISGAPMATQHAIARFFVPILARSGWALFCDGDVLFRRAPEDLFAGLDPGKALYCVHHRHVPPTDQKMDGQFQTRYARKNWSSVMAFNCDHPANRELTLDLLNTVPGRDLHRFCWLDDSLIGALDPRWNVLVGEENQPPDPFLAHFTSGVPDMPGYADQPWAGEWFGVRDRWIA